jgi:hypothetical protein
MFCTVQVTKLPLQHKIRKIGMICSVCTDRGLVYSAKERIFSNMLHVRYVHLTKGHMRQTDLFIREDVI